MKVACIYASRPMDVRCFHEMSVGACTKPLSQRARTSIVAPMGVRTRLSTSIDGGAGGGGGMIAFDGIGAIEAKFPDCFTMSLRFVPVRTGVPDEYGLMPPSPVAKSRV